MSFELFMKTFEGIRKKDEEAYTQLSETLQEGSCKKGELIFTIGKTARKLIVLKSGIVKQFRYKDDGTVHITWFGFPGDVVTPHRSFVKQEPSYESVSALEDCEFIAINRDQMYKLASEYHAIETFSRELLEMYYIASDERLFFLQSFTARQKYDYILEHMPQFIQLVPQKELASFLGITRETLSRIRKFN